MASKNYKSINNKLNFVSNQHEQIRTERRWRLTSSWLIILLLISCKTTPQTPEELLEQSLFVPLSGGASVYVFADVKKAWPVLELLPYEELKNRQTVRILERTDFAVIALFPPQSGRRFQAAGWGNYPKSQANIGFTFSRFWRRQRPRTALSYWYSAAHGLSIAMEKTKVFAASSLSAFPFDPHESGAQIPEGFLEFRGAASGAILSCWLDDPAPVIARMLAGIPIQFPVQKLFLNLLPVEENMYEADIRFQLGSAVQARGMAAILNLAANYAAAGGSFTALFLANTPVQNGSSLDIKTSRLKKSEIADLLSLFSNL